MEDERLRLHDTTELAHSVFVPFLMVPSIAPILWIVARSELEDENVAVVSLYPGIVVTEKMDTSMKNPAEFEEKVWPRGWRWPSRARLIIA